MTRRQKLVAFAWSLLAAVALYALVVPTEAA
jgi:hypothetical protein